MKRIHALRPLLAAVVLGALATACALPQIARASTRVTVPGGTLVSVQVVDKISSATANVGDKFGIQAASDVIVNGWVVIPKGAQGEGEVISVDRAGKHGHAGSMSIRMDWIYDSDGHKIRLTDQNKTQQGEGKQGQSSTVTIISAAFLGLPGLFAHNFVKGKDIELDSTHTLQTYIDDSVYVSATKKAPADPGFAPSAGGSAPKAPPS